MMTASTSSPRTGRNVHHALNGWTCGWCFVVADSPVSKSAARAAKKAVNAVFLDYAANKAWPYMVNGVLCDVLTDHGVSLQAAAEKGRKMANALLKYGITSRVYVMTDKQYGLGHPVGSSGTRARKCAHLKGLELVMNESHPQMRTRWVLTTQQSEPVYQTSL